MSEINSELDRAPGEDYYRKLTQDIIEAQLPHLSPDEKNAKVQELLPTIKQLDEGIEEHHRSKLYE